ncbi:hypothetical protein NXG27_02040 [Megasphaera paucivorans]|uniref:Uncharacterized protein n=1 Tax=Megasphaera paucivorans TaxID=349095 RepID=A0A1G9T2R5_9FIRM|nr:hypothetical protein [Megasphaera paucivorans]SDM41940.1 hypothetical protein SAMN05660299_00852 [Megasphaera paucivorans]
MYKKILALLVTFLAIGSMLVSAMFFDDNPRYIQVGHSDTTISYMDMNSIQSIRYDPPFYMIRATVITYDYTRNTATGFENNFFYNFNAQTVKAQLIGAYSYDTIGKAVSRQQFDGQDPNLCDQYSVNGIAANKAFFNCYNMTFYHNFNKTQKKE